jgi:hypothetical protein
MPRHNLQTLQTLALHVSERSIRGEGTAGRRVGKTDAVTPIEPWHEVTELPG